MQVNVGRSSSAHDIALHYAQQNKIDILLIQEPWINSNLHARVSKTHPVFESFSPLSSWHSRPRVFTYVRKTSELRPYQTACDLSRDIIQIVITCVNNRRLPIWNVYNAPTGSVDAGMGLSALFSCPDTPFFVGGDFNLRHPLWDSAVFQAYRSCSDLIDWYDKKGLRLLNPIETPTHKCGGTLDLSFCLEISAVCEIRPDLHTTSDHETLITSINFTRHNQNVGKLSYKDLDNELFLRLLGNNHHHTPLPTLKDLELETNTIIELIHTALTGACPRKSCRNVGSPWWNDDCRFALNSYRRARREGQATVEKLELQKTVRKAKKMYWNSIVAETKSLPQAYRIVKWHNSGSRYQSPPFRLEDASEPVFDPQEKARLLHKVLLCRHLDSEDIPTETPSVPVRSIPWDPISPQEAFTATCQVSSKAPGVDELTTTCLRLAWGTLGSRITNLFNHCLKLGAHPSAFKRATVIILPKTGKRDRANPKSYRPIALLSCLGKGLERLIARRLSYWALELKILARNQCCAVKHRSASDLTTALLCDIHQAWDKKKVAGIVTTDVKGAFDGVLRNRLIHRLRTQGWPNSLLMWVASFLSDRSVHIRLDQITTQPLPIVCGLPQGSPVSPILFLLYIEPLLRLSRGRFGYADDAAFFSSANSLEECQIKLQNQLDYSLSWAAENGVQFDADKTELIYFHNKRKYIELPLRIRQKLVTPKDELRWLGILFDRKLNFKSQVRVACQRARVVTDHVRRLGNTTRGTQPGILRQAVQGCAFATLFYGAETWYGPRTSQWALNQLQVAMNRAARAVLPVFKTFPISALLRETGWGPVTAWLDRIHDRLAVRIASADPGHPLRRRWNSSLFTWIRRRQALEMSISTDDPPWLILDRASIREQIGATGRQSGLKTFERWAQLRNPLDLVVFSDGSMSADGNAGAGYCIYRGSQEILSGSIPLGGLAHAYDAEIVGAVAGLRAACTHWMARFAKNVTVCLDNEVAAIRLHTGRASPSSHTRIKDFQTLRESWSKRERAPTIESGAVLVRWIPGHQGIIGNERADTLAKEACTMVTQNKEASIARAKSLLEERYNLSLVSYWTSEAPKRYKDLGIKISSRIPPELILLPRCSLGKLLAARSGHGDFASYHRRFHHTDSELNCSCGQEKTPEHQFSCQLTRRLRGCLRGHLKHNMNNVKWLLGSTAGARAFHEWLMALRNSETA